MSRQFYSFVRNEWIVKFGNRIVSKDEAVKFMQNYTVSRFGALNSLQRMLAYNEFDTMGSRHEYLKYRGVK